MQLHELRPGEKARILGFASGDKEYRQQLMVMGLTPNTEIEFVRSAPMGDPVQIRVRQSNLSLRKSEAVLLNLERV